ncbi:hypothetical protein MTO96_048527 [Rhipicephalus appendiculatus]
MATRGLTCSAESAVHYAELEPKPRGNHVEPEHLCSRCRRTKVPKTGALFPMSARASVDWAKEASLVLSLARLKHGRAKSRAPLYRLLSKQNPETIGRRGGAAACTGLPPCGFIEGASLCLVEDTPAPSNTKTTSSLSAIASAADRRPPPPPPEVIRNPWQQRTRESYTISHYSSVAIMRLRRGLG